MFKHIFLGKSNELDTAGRTCLFWGGPEGTKKRLCLFRRISPSIGALCLLGEVRTGPNFEIEMNLLLLGLDMIVSDDSIMILHVFLVGNSRSTFKFKELHVHIFLIWNQTTSQQNPQHFFLLPLCGAGLQPPIF